MHTAPAPRIELNLVRHYWRGRGGYQPVAIVEGMMQGTLEETWRYFTGRADDGNEYMVSAHYGVARDGRIWQFVSDEDTAWSNGLLKNPDLSIGWLKEVHDENVNCNLVTLSIEYEGFSGEPLTDEQYQAALELHSHLVKKWQIEVDAEHIIGRNIIDSLDNADNPGAAFPLMDFLRDLLEREAAESTPAPAEAVPVHPLGFADEIFVTADAPNVVVEQAANPQEPEHISQEIAAVMLPVDDLIPPLPELTPEVVVAPESASAKEQLNLQPAFVEEPLSDEFAVFPPNAAEPIATIPLRDETGVTSGFLGFLADEELAESEQPGEVAALPDLEHLLDDYTSHAAPAPAEPKFPDQFAPADFLSDTADYASTMETTRSETFSLEDLGLQKDTYEPPNQIFGQESAGQSFELPDIPGFAIPAEKSGHAHLDAPTFEAPAEIPDLDFFSFENEPATAPAPKAPPQPQEDFVNSSLLADLLEDDSQAVAITTPDPEANLIDFSRHDSPNKRPPEEMRRMHGGVFEKPEITRDEYLTAPGTSEAANVDDNFELPDFLNEPLEAKPELELPNFPTPAEPELPDFLSNTPGKPEPKELPNFPTATVSEQLPDFLTARVIKPELELEPEPEPELPNFLRSSKTAAEPMPELPDFDFLSSPEVAPSETAEESKAHLQEDLGAFLLDDDSEPAKAHLQEDLGAFLLDDNLEQPKAKTRQEDLGAFLLDDSLEQPKTKTQQEDLGAFLLDDDAEPTRAKAQQEDLGGFLLDDSFGKTPTQAVEEFTLPDFLDLPDLPDEELVETAAPASTTTASAKAVAFSDLLEAEPTYQTPVEDLNSALGGYTPEELPEQPTNFGTAFEPGNLPELEDLPPFLEPKAAEATREPQPEPVPELPSFADWVKEPEPAPSLPDFEAAVYNPAANDHTPAFNPVANFEPEPKLSDMAKSSYPFEAQSSPEFNYPFELPREAASPGRPTYPAEFEATSPLDEYRRANEQPGEVAAPKDFLNDFYKIEEFPAEPVIKKQTEPLVTPGLEVAGSSERTAAGFDKFFVETEDTSPQAPPQFNMGGQPTAPTAKADLEFDLAELDNELFPLFADEPVIPPTKQPTAPLRDFSLSETAREPEFKAGNFAPEHKPATVFEPVPEEKFSTVFEFEPKPAPVVPEAAPDRFSTRHEQGLGRPWESNPVPAAPEVSQKQVQEFAPVFETPVSPAPVKSFAESPLDFVFDDMDLEQVLTPAPDGFRSAFIGLGAIAVELANLRSDTAFDAAVIREAEEGENFNFDGWKYGPELRGSNRWLHFSNEGGGWIHSVLVKLKQPFDYGD